MIHDVDEALRTLIRRDALEAADVEVLFDAPTKEWASRRNAPTVDLYLYDLREDVRRRHVGRADARGGDGFVEARLQPPRWFKLSYMLTAWTQRPEDEHRLLSALLATLLRHDTVPRSMLGGTLADLPWPVPMTVALPPPEDRALSDTWSALGGELKPSIDLVVTVPFDLARVLPFGPPVMEEPRVRLGDETVGGRRRRHGAPAGDAERPLAVETVAGDAGARPSADEPPRRGRVFHLEELG